VPHRDRRAGPAPAFSDMRIDGVYPMPAATRGGGWPQAAQGGSAEGIRALISPLLREEEEEDLPICTAAAEAAVAGLCCQHTALAQRHRVLSFHSEHGPQRAAQGDAGHSSTIAAGSAHGELPAKPRAQRGGDPGPARTGHGRVVMPAPGTAERTGRSARMPPGANGGLHGRQERRVGHPSFSPSICWITVGGIGQKRGDAAGQNATRDYLDLTVSFDHNMVDAAPTARFTQRLKELIESGYGLTLDEQSIDEPIAS